MRHTDVREETDREYVELQVHKKTESGDEEVLGTVAGTQQS